MLIESYLMYLSPKPSSEAVIFSTNVTVAGRIETKCVRSFVYKRQRRKYYFYNLQPSFKCCHDGLEQFIGISCGAVVNVSEKKNVYIMWDTVVLADKDVRNGIRVTEAFSDCALF